jgi:hypothetical protein
MFRTEKPTLRLKFELEIPDAEGPSKKFCVTRTLKTKWGDDVREITKQIHDEFTNYKGSFIGDVILSLYNLYSSEEKPVDVEDVQRSVDVAKWASAVFESMIFSCIDDEVHKDFLENQAVQDWDGSLRVISRMTQKEIKEANLEKITLLLQPKLKQALFLMAKMADKNL